MFIITLDTIIAQDPVPMLGSNLEPIRLGPKATYCFMSRRNRYAYKALGLGDNISSRFAKRHFHRKPKTFRDWN
jgi:hypothetical protein